MSVTCGARFTALPRLSTLNLEAPQNPLYIRPSVQMPMKLTGVQDAIVPVDGGESAPEPLPLRLVVVWQTSVRVMQQRDEHQVRVDHKEGGNVQLERRREEGSGRGG